MELSVIILNYKVPYYLLQCVDSVTKALTSIASEIIVVDNNSEDESCQLIKDNFPHVKVLQNKENLGFARGNNIGIKEARGKFICLLNPDTIVSKNTFSNLLSFADKKNDFGAIGPRLIDGTGNFLPESKRSIPTPSIAFQKLIGVGKNYYAPMHFAKNGTVPILVGAFMLMRKDRYWEVNGLDEDYFMYGEDIDLSYKFIKAGYQNYYVGSEIVLHFKGESTAKNTVYKKRFFDAMQIFYQKHFAQHSFRKAMVKAGLALAKNFYFLTEKKKNKTTFKQVLLVGGNFDLLNQLSKKYKEPIHLINKKLVTKKKFSNSLFIFISENVSYKEIFYIMGVQKNKNNFFRIKPGKFNFIIGSDSNTAKGEVFKL
ncbi:glycosyltransferase family 2 protein [Haloflavibacter putidus]|uniref:Glycosyltransferase family 2 protein n=1 Tax=Haloflavibacter putidus TaxID=2576776 RepID=A0A507ZFE8_9FLAO|nr:glycosyltransferase family 2 protein [Haloflavibacter putidus]TQD35461.1 glycosyltransferase family 2 protein [Haloflavibacter putidus]